jgi:hypothetical protein
MALTPASQAPHVVYVEKILRGAKPSDLAVEQPTKFETARGARSGRDCPLFMRSPTSND